MITDGFSALRDAIVALTVTDYVGTIPGGKAERRIKEEVRTQYFSVLLEGVIEPEDLIRVMDQRRREFIANNIDTFVLNGKEGIGQNDGERADPVRGQESAGKGLDTSPMEPRSGV